MCVGGYIEPSCAILGHLGGQLAPSEALLEPSWAKKEALTPREPPPLQVQGRGLGGGVNPSPKGKKGGWKKGRGWDLNHSRPKGLVGLSSFLGS